MASNSQYTVRGVRSDLAAYSLSSTQQHDHGGTTNSNRLVASRQPFTKGFSQTVDLIPEIPLSSARYDHFRTGDSTAISTAPQTRFGPVLPPILPLNKSNATFGPSSFVPDKSLLPNNTRLATESVVPAPYVAYPRARRDSGGGHPGLSSPYSHSSSSPLSPNSVSSRSGSESYTYEASSPQASISTQFALADPSHEAIYAVSSRAPSNADAYDPAPRCLDDRYAVSNPFKIHQSSSKNAISVHGETINYGPKAGSQVRGHNITHGATVCFSSASPDKKHKCE